MNDRGNKTFNDAVDKWFSDPVDTSKAKFVLHRAISALFDAGLVSQEEYERVDVWTCM